MQWLFDLATRISTPLALAGFVTAAFLFIVRALIAKGIFPTLTRQMSGDIIKLIIRCFFIVSLVTTALGFAGFIVTHSVARPGSQAIIQKTGDATTKGPNSPANTGNVGSITVNDSSASPPSKPKASQPKKKVQ